MPRGLTSFAEAGITLVGIDELTFALAPRHVTRGEPTEGFGIFVDLHQRQRLPILTQTKTLRDLDVVAVVEAVVEEGGSRNALRAHHELIAFPMAHRITTFAQ